MPSRLSPGAAHSRAEALGLRLWPPPSTPGGGVGGRGKEAGEKGAEGEGREPTGGEGRGGRARHSSETRSPIPTPPSAWSPDGSPVLSSLSSRPGCPKVFLVVSDSPFFLPLSLQPPMWGAGGGAVYELHLVAPQSRCWLAPLADLKPTCTP